MKSLSLTFVVVLSLLAVGHSEKLVYKITVLTAGGFQDVTGNIQVILKSNTESHEIPIFNEATKIKYLHMYQARNENVPFKIDELKTVIFKHDANGPLTLAQIRVIPSYIDDDGERNRKYQYRRPKDKTAKISPGEEVPLEIC